MSHSKRAYDRLRGLGAKSIGYVIQGEGDAWGCEIFRTFDDALDRIREIVTYNGPWPQPGIDRDRSDKGHIQFDPEDDRVTIWEVLPTGHKRVVWHFSGWHWNTSDFLTPEGDVLEQGALPGDSRPLQEAVQDEDDDGFYGYNA